MAVPVGVVGVGKAVGARTFELGGMVGAHVAVMVVSTGTDTVTVWMLMTDWVLVTNWVLVTSWVLVTVIFCNGLVMALEGGLVVIGERLVSVPAWNRPVVVA